MSLAESNPVENSLPFPPTITVRVLIRSIRFKKRFGHPHRKGPIFSGICSSVFSHALGTYPVHPVAIYGIRQDFIVAFDITFRWGIAFFNESIGSSPPYTVMVFKRSLESCDKYFASFFLLQDHCFSRE